jgi:two-component system nitrogen regulation sensor histidine kinase NtrY
MVFRNFRLNCIIRLVLIAATMLLFFHLIYRTHLFATLFIVGLLVVLQLVLLFRFIEKTNQTLTRFLQSIRYSDFSQPFASKVKGRSFEYLSAAFKEVTSEFQRVRTEKEEHFRYIQTIVQHVGVGLISYKTNGEVALVNNAAKRLLKVPDLRKIQQLESLSKDLVDRLLRIKPGEKKQVKLEEDGRLLQLSIYATGFILHQQRYILVSLQNIQSELEEKEMESWQTLIRTLTHEIMNSIAPISSLASTARTLLTEDGGDSGHRDDETVSDVVDAVKTIEKRSVSLMNFLEDYRKLTRVPSPNYEVFQVKGLLERIQTLMKDDLARNSIVCRMEVDPETLELTADPVLMEQVLINLCKNAVEALENTPNPTIQLIAKTDGKGNPVLQIIDNGPGIKADVLEKIFIPFFTTKKEGSGIGLSLSKQIMRLHGGTLSVSSNPGARLDEVTVFTLRF